MRPAGMDPHFFADQRAKDREWVETLLSSRGEGGPEAATAILMRHLSKFNRGAAWDAQRIGGAYRPEFVDYATVAIGLHAAAAGISRGISLHVQNLFAITSHFASDADMGSRFRNLLVRSSILALVLGTGLFLVHSVLDWFRSDCSITVVQHLPSPDGAKEAFVKDWFCEGPMVTNVTAEVSLVSRPSDRAAAHEIPLLGIDTAGVTEDRPVIAWATSSMLRVTAPARSLLKVGTRHADGVTIDLRFVPSWDAKRAILKEPGREPDPLEQPLGSETMGANR